MEKAKEINLTQIKSYIVRWNLQTNNIWKMLEKSPVVDLFLIKNWYDQKINWKNYLNEFWAKFILSEILIWTEQAGELINNKRHKTDCMDERPTNIDDEYPSEYPWWWAWYIINYIAYLCTKSLSETDLRNSIYNYINLEKNNNSDFAIYKHTDDHCQWEQFAHNDKNEYNCWCGFIKKALDINTIDENTGLNKYWINLQWIKILWKLFNDEKYTINTPPKMLWSHNGKWIIYIVPNPNNMDTSLNIKRNININESWETLDVFVINWHNNEIISSDFVDSIKDSWYSKSDFDKISSVQINQIKKDIANDVPLFFGIFDWKILELCDANGNKI